MGSASSFHGSGLIEGPGSKRINWGVHRVGLVFFAVMSLYKSCEESSGDLDPTAARRLYAAALKFG